MQLFSGNYERRVIENGRWYRAEDAITADVNHVGIDEAACNYSVDGNTTINNGISCLARSADCIGASAERPAAPARHGRASSASSACASSPNRNVLIIPTIYKVLVML